MVQNIINGKSQLKQFDRTKDRGLLIVQDGFLEHNWILTMFNFYLKRSYTMPNLLSYLPKSFHKKENYREVIVVQKGLICIGHVYRRRGIYLSLFSICVSNPLTKTWHMLPHMTPMDQNEFYSIHLVVDKDNNSYKVALLAFDKNSFVYSSDSNTWMIGPIYDSHTNKTILNATNHGRYLYALVGNNTYDSQSKILLMAFDLKNAIWLEEINMETINHFLQDATINSSSRMHLWEMRLGTLLVCSKHLYIIIPLSCANDELTYVIYMSNQHASPTNMNFQQITKKTIKKIRESSCWEFISNSVWFTWKEDGHDYISSLQIEPTRSLWWKYDIALQVWTSTLISGRCGSKICAKLFLYEPNWMNVT